MASLRAQPPGSLACPRPQTLPWWGSAARPPGEEGGGAHCAHQLERWKPGRGCWETARAGLTACVGRVHSRWSRAAPRPHCRDHCDCRRPVHQCTGAVLRWPHTMPGGETQGQDPRMGVAGAPSGRPMLAGFMPWLRQACRMASGPQGKAKRVVIRRPAWLQNISDVRLCAYWMLYLRLVPALNWTGA